MMKKLLLLLLFLPCTLQAQIFRCEAKGATYFSQIPCDDGSEAIVIEDRPMFSDNTGNVAPPDQQGSAPVETRRTQAENMQEFVSTLRRQRSEQIEQIDRDIGKLEEQLKTIGETPAENDRRKDLGEQLASLRSSRGSIAEQYESMIVEAESRVATLTAQAPSTNNEAD